MGKKNKPLLTRDGLELVHRLRYGHDEVDIESVSNPILTVKFIARFLRLSESQVTLRLQKFKALKLRKIDHIDTDMVDENGDTSFLV